MDVNFNGFTIPRNDIEIGRFFKGKNMRLYHGTSLTCWEKIKETGLIPREMGAQSNWEHSVESDPNTVYLTNAYAMYFALQSVNLDEIGTDKAVIIEIDTEKLNKKKFVADEDALEQASRNSNDGLPEHWDMHERTIHYRDMAEEYAKAGYGHDWSLSVLGTCGYKGAIPLEAITRVAIIDIKEQAPLTYMFLDPTITLLNYKFVGAKYRAYSQLIFGDTPSNDDIKLANALAEHVDQDFERNGIVIEEVATTLRMKSKLKR